MTIARSLSRGAFEIFGGSVNPSDSVRSNRVLSESRNSKSESLSDFLLSELGIANKEIASTITGDKSAFTIRHFASYMFTEETPMISEASPIVISTKSSDTFNKNVLKFILTGVDDSSIIKTPDRKQQHQANAGKLEIVEEMLNAAYGELLAMYPGVDPEDLDLEAQNERLEETLASFREKVALGQAKLDGLLQEWRTASSERDELSDREGEIALSVDRFRLLATSYASDIERLIALEEGAAALLAGSKRTCVVCGADPEHQHADHGFEAVETSQFAVQSELRKVRAESAGLGSAVASLLAERTGLQRRISILVAALEAKSADIRAAKLVESTVREEYESIDRARTKLRDAMSIERRIRGLKLRHAELSKFKAKSVPRGSIVVGVGTVVGDQLAEAVEKIFHAWHYPGNPRIAFNERTHDVLLNGTERNSNGKGVRALMNAAFKIGVMDVCRQRGLPHPGVITLDSPLLSYRDPLRSRHGELSEDEKAVKTAGLKGHFYEYLIRRSDAAQFIIVENQDPPFVFPGSVREHVFAGEHSTEGRSGLF